MRTADRFPDFKDGWIVIDARVAPRLAHAIGSKNYRTRYGVDQKLRDAKFLLARDASFLHAVPVDGPNGVFSLDYIDADGVILKADGRILLAEGVATT